MEHGYGEGAIKNDPPKITPHEGGASLFRMQPLTPQLPKQPPGIQPVPRRWRRFTSREGDIQPLIFVWGRPQWGRPTVVNDYLGPL